MLKIVVLGGTGLVGSSVVQNAQRAGSDVVAASPSTGVDTVTGEGLAEAFDGADVVVDVTNSPSFEDAAVLEFFERSTNHIADEATSAGVEHLVVLSIVGCDRLPDSGYMRAKAVQEQVVKNSSTPYSIVHATQFFEFVTGIADEATEGGTVRLPPVLFQPIAAKDVAATVSEVAAAAPVLGTIEIGGPDRFRFDELVRETLEAREDPRTVVADPDACYYGTKLAERSLVPDDDARLGPTHYVDWLLETAGRSV